MRWLWMSALCIALGAIAIPVAIGDKMETESFTKRSFDHKRHAEAIKSSKGMEVGCKGACHNATDEGKWAQQGKEEHARCFSSCHKFTASCGTLAKREGKVCTVCHPTFKDNCVPKGFSRYASDNKDFGAQYSHKKHIRPSAKTGEQCETCHGEFGEGAPKQGSLESGHALCSNCHARGMSPRINKSCDGCHVATKTGNQVADSYQADEFSVAGAFDHKSHASIQRVGTEGRTCLMCHDNIKEADSDTQIPRPTMEGCTTNCHNGDKAFNALGTTCTRCHLGGPKKGGL